jgi:hypothetical protein
MTSKIDKAIWLAEVSSKVKTFPSKAFQLEFACETHNLIKLTIFEISKLTLLNGDKGSNGAHTITPTVQRLGAPEVFSALVAFQLFFRPPNSSSKVLGSRVFGFHCFSRGRAQISGLILQGEVKGSHRRLPPQAHIPVSVCAAGDFFFPFPRQPRFRDLITIVAGTAHLVVWSQPDGRRCSNWLTTSLTQ